MSKPLSGLIKTIIVITFLFAQSVVLAVSMPAPDMPIGNSLFMGQTHRYYVTFRGNGEAIIYAGIGFTNTSDNVMREFSFEVPSEVKDMTIFQYDQSDTRQLMYMNGADAVTTSDKPASTMLYPYYGGNLYSKVKFSQDKLKYTVELAKPLEPNQQSNLLLGYTSRNFSSEFLGGFGYNFKSLKVDSRIENLSISIVTDSGLFLKNANSAVTYNEATDAAAMSSSIADKSISNNNLDSIVGMLGSYGNIYKTYKQLASGEIVNVEGEYSATWIRLYAREILTLIAVIGILVSAVFVLKVYLDKRQPADKTIQHSTHWLVVDLAYGLLSAILVGILSLVVNYANYYFGGNIYLAGIYSPATSLIFALVILLLYVLFGLAAPIYRGVKHGWMSFIITLCSEILFLLILGVSIALLLSGNIMNYPYPEMVKAL